MTPPTASRPATFQQRGHDGRPSSARRRGPGRARSSGRGRWPAREAVRGQQLTEQPLGRVRCWPAERSSARSMTTAGNGSCWSSIDPRAGAGPGSSSGCLRAGLPGRAARTRPRAAGRCARAAGRRAPAPDARPSGGWVATARSRRSSRSAAWFARPPRGRAGSSPGRAANGAATSPKSTRASATSPLDTGATLGGCRRGSSLPSQGIAALAVRPMLGAADDQRRPMMELTIHSADDAPARVEGDRSTASRPISASCRTWPRHRRQSPALLDRVRRAAARPSDPAGSTRCSARSPAWPSASRSTTPTASRSTRPCSASLGVDDAEIDRMRPARCPSTPAPRSMSSPAASCSTGARSTTTSVARATAAGLTTPISSRSSPSAPSPRLVGIVDNLAGRVELDDFLGLGPGAEPPRSLRQSVARSCDAERPRDSRLSDRWPDNREAPEKGASRRSAIPRESLESRRADSNRGPLHYE